MGEYVKDQQDTLARLSDLVESVRFAEYELAAAVAIAKVVGMDWETIGEGLGYAEGGRKQGAYQWFRRNGGRFGVLMEGKPFLGGIDDAERRRIGKLIGIGERVSRFQVRIITSGRRGVTKVVRSVVSTHLDADVAWRKADRRPGAEVWRVDPNGDEVQLSRRHPMR